MITPEAFLEGQAILIDKPYGWTSHDVVGKIRMPIKRYCQNKKMKIGHAGTLDPLATGLLIVVTGKFTKKADDYQAMEKGYSGSLILGEITASYDKETEVIESRDISHITEEQIRSTAASFIGQIEQMPPVYSSVKVNGVRAYAYARLGEEVALRKKNIEVFSFDITGIQMPEVFFHIRCSKGTYIRSLAHDLGLALGCGAHLSSLRRTHIGAFSVEDAVSPEAFLSTLHPA